MNVRFSHKQTLSDIGKSSAAVKNGENKTFMTTGTLIVGVILFEAIQYCCKYR